MSVQTVLASWSAGGHDFDAIEFVIDHTPGDCGPGEQCSASEVVIVSARIVSADGMTGLAVFTPEAINLMGADDKLIERLIEAGDEARADAIAGDKEAAAELRAGR